MDKKKLIVIAGPTASGKTAVSIELAKRIGGEIISADSMQIYQYMDIGSAKVSREEMQGIPHYLIDQLNPAEAFHVARFQSMAQNALDQIYAKNKIPIIAGGTGFYIQSLVRDIEFSVTDQELAIRKKVEEYYEKEGRDALHGWFGLLDEEGARAIHPNNIKRVMRGIEYYLLTGQKISEHNQEQKEKETPYDLTYIVLTMERELLYHRIDKRVDQMIEKGLVEEVRFLKEKGFSKDMTSMQGLGYKEILDYLEGETTLEEAVYRIKRDTRHFAKRQLTWFRREKDTQWIHADYFQFDSTKICDEILRYMK
ncbi:MAG: tRNA (adenosine(37)-N6)-dimethylallyltransferase MiaA [Vallitaleaceae bacterium]|nr:tRNA (adenosine(37)-N6)-dimethylallyltransferase MiaA [Vallitaleaceae bacterium]